MPYSVIPKESPHYRVECTGQRVHVYDANGQELACLKNFRYTYHAAISADERCFAVRSAGGVFYLYDLPTVTLVQKRRVARDADGAQDGYFFFSPDGRTLLSVDHYGGIHARFSVYTVPDLTMVACLYGDSDTVEIHYMEPSKTDPHVYFLMGYERDGNGIASQRFVLPVRVDTAIEIAGEEQTITDGEYDFHAARLECLYGFGTFPARQAGDSIHYYGFDFTRKDLEDRKHTLEGLWTHHRAHP